jgi:pyruvate dehydrogenase E1 component alpha subunit
MWILRKFEETLLDLSKAGDLRGSLHLTEGQEAGPAGACLALRKDDAITMTYRGHGYYLAKGVNIKEVLAEIIGRENGTSRGRGGKMHVFDPEHGVLGANGIVAGGVPTAVGAAFASWLKGDDSVALSAFGDGAMNQGVMHEVMNMAGLWKLPVVFYCENNLYAEMTSLEASSGVTEVHKRVAAYGFEGVKIDGNDPLEVFDAVTAAVEKARAGGGPTLIEAMTYRTCGHYQLDPGFGGYRTREEVEEWKAKSPLIRFGAVLKEKKICKDKDLKKIEEEAAAIVAEAKEFALAGPIPSVDGLADGVFA